LLRDKGLYVHGVHIKPAAVRSHFASNNLTPTRIDYLLNPSDRQDVKLAYDILQEIWSSTPCADLTLAQPFSVPSNVSCTNVTFPTNNTDSTTNNNSTGSKSGASGITATGYAGALSFLIALLTA
jgi:hypothetical protein